MLRLELLKKEFREYIKTPKGLILGVLFLFFAIASPVLAKYINEILLAVAADIPITLPEPTLQDSWLQFYKNMNTICIIVYLIVMTGAVSQEKNKGSIILVLTKKVTRFQFLFSKFLVGTAIFTVLMIVSVLVSGWYTNLLFGSYQYEGLIASNIMIWLMGVFFTAMALLVSVLGKTATTSALFGFFGFAILQVLNISSSISRFNPAGASSIVNEILVGTITVGELWVPIASALAGTLIMFVLSYLIFKKQEI